METVQMFLTLDQYDRIKDEYQRIFRLHQKKPDSTNFLIWSGAVNMLSAMCGEFFADDLIYAWEHQVQKELDKKKDRTTSDDDAVNTSI